MPELSIDAADADRAAGALRAGARQAERQIDRQLARSADDVAAEARSAVGSRPGGGTYPRRPSRMIGTRGAAVVVSGAPWAVGAEKGARHAWVFGRKVPAARVSRRQFPAYQGTGDPRRGAGGVLVAPVIGRRWREIEAKLTENVEETYTDELRRRGIRR